MTRGHVAAALIMVVSSYAFFTVAPSSAAYEFDEYVWGQAKDEVKATLDQKNIPYGDLGPEVCYTGNLFGNKCDITLGFTPVSQELARVEITWDDMDTLVVADFKEKLQAILEEKYGEPGDILGAEKEIHWGSGDSYELLVLKWLVYPVLTYYGGEYYRKALTQGRPSDEASAEAL